MVLFFTPAVVPVTFTETVHEAPGASVLPDRLADPGGGPGANLGGATTAASAVPPQVLFKLLGELTAKPNGRLSVKATPFNVELALALETVKVRLVVPLRGMVAAPKTLAMVGGLMTVRVEEEVLPLPASEESMVTLLLKTPSVAP